MKAKTLTTEPMAAPRQDSEQKRVTSCQARANAFLARPNLGRNRLKMDGFFAPT
jgi:hypothetical protein